MVLAVTSPARQEQGEVFEQQNGRPLVENANKSQLKQPRAREITSRYKSPSTTTPTPTTSRSSTPSRRFPSPVIGRASNAAEPGKRATSVERRRLDSPGRSSTDSRVSRGTSTPPNSSSSNASSQRIWPSAQKLSMSMQAEPKQERDKQEKLISNGDHSLKPTAANGVHKGSDSPSRLRKPTPERKTTPERRSTPVRRLSSEQAENAKPKGDFNRFSSSPKTGMSRSMDFSSEREKSGNHGAASLVVQGRAVNCATRKVRQAPPIRSLTRSVNEGPLPDSPQSISRTMLSESRGRTKLKPEKIEPTGAIASLQQADDAFRQFPDEAEFTSLVGHPSLDTSDCESISSSGSAATVKTTRSAGKLRPSLSEQDFSAAIATGRRLRSLSVSSGSMSTASWSLSPGRLSSTSQPPSPSKSVSSSSSPFRGMASPTRSRVSPFQLPPNNRLSSVSSLLNFPIRGGKKAQSQQEEAQSSRLLHNRWLQWRFVNARAEAARKSQKASVERSICNAWLQISELRKSVAMKRIKLQQARGIQKLQQILSSQGPLLETWAALQPEHSAALSGSLDSLESAVLRVPVTGGAKADVVAIREALGFSVDVTASLATLLHNLMPKIERMDESVSELAEVTRQEKALLSDCSSLLDTIAGLEVEARSLQTHFVQVGGEKARPSRKPQLTINNTTG